MVVDDLRVLLGKCVPAAGAAVFTMYNRSKRDLDFAYNSPAKPHVGPGAYKPKPVKNFAQKGAFVTCAGARYVPSSS